MISTTLRFLKQSFAMKESSSPDCMKNKKSELRLYCDLLMQQAHMVKEAACKQSPPDVEKLEEATTLLSATCDSFIETLEACSKLAHEQFQMNMPSMHPSEPVIRQVKNH